MWAKLRELVFGAPESVTVDAQGVTRVAGRLREEVRWDELREVEIVTTAGGPMVDDVFWVLHGRDRGCVVAHTAKESEALLERLQTLEGFDNGAVCAAMSSTANARFLCWRRAGVAYRS